MTGPNNPHFVDLPAVKLAEVKPGDRLIIDSGLTCRGPGEVEIKGDDHGLYFECCADDQEAHEQGADAQVDAALLTDKHYLDGQLADDGETLIGLAKPMPGAVA